MKKTEEGLSHETGYLTVKETNEALWKIIGRFDTHISGTNSKAAFLIAFNTFIVGGIALKWQDVRSIIGDAHSQVFICIAVLLMVTSAAALASLYYTFLAIYPYLISPRRPNEYHSNVFFGSICEHATPDKYLDSVADLRETTLRTDLAFQAYVLASGLNEKFAAIRRATQLVVYCLLPTFVLSMVVTVCTLFYDSLIKVGK